MKVLIYVEGPSDKAALGALFRELIELKRAEGIGIDFFEAPRGNKKQKLLTEVPVRAVDILCAQPDSVVVALPDLYPQNVGFPHQTYAELQKGMLQNFRDALSRKNIQDDRLLERFHIFCLKHDLEVLVLAAKEQLLERLKATKPKVLWTEPVENQNHGNPPKRIVERLFAEHGERYHEAVDASLILARANYQTLAGRCPQCFKPFVEFLESLRRRP